MKCEAHFREGVSAQNFMRLGWASTWHRCEREATLLVNVQGQGKLKICDQCLPEFRKWATLPWTVRKLRNSER